MNRFARSTGTFCTRSRYFFTRMPRRSPLAIIVSTSKGVSFDMSGSRQRGSKAARQHGSGDLAVPHCACPAPIDKSQKGISCSCSSCLAPLRQQFVAWHQHRHRHSGGSSHLLASIAHRGTVVYVASAQVPQRKRKQSDEGHER